MRKTNKPYVLDYKARRPLAHREIERDHPFPPESAIAATARIEAQTGKIDASVMKRADEILSHLQNG